MRLPLAGMGERSPSPSLAGQWDPLSPAHADSAHLQSPSGGGEGRWGRLSVEN